MTEKISDEQKREEIRRALKARMELIIGKKKEIKDDEGDVE